jgi:hypothetical protein
MVAARPLREVFTDLTGDEEARRAHAADPDSFLAAHGHPDLPSDLVAEAVVSYADTAPPEVAEHLAPYVLEHSSVPREQMGAEPAEPESWFELIASAPGAEEIGAAPDLDHELFGDAPLDHDALDGGDPTDHAGLDFDFGRGAAAGASFAAVAVGGHDEYAGDAPTPDATSHDLSPVDDLRDRSFADTVSDLDGGLDTDDADDDADPGDNDGVDL